MTQEYKVTFFDKNPEGKLSYQTKIFKNDYEAISFAKNKSRNNRTVIVNIWDIINDDGISVFCAIGHLVFKNDELIEDEG